MSKRQLVCVVGATAVGKTSVSIKIAKHFNAPIVSCDARQFYREIPIGTAAPTQKEMDGVVHYFVGNKSIVESYNVGDYEREAIELLSRLFLDYAYVVMVGGSGLFLKAILEGLDDVPSVDAKIRTNLEQRLIKEGIRALQEELKNVDPKSYQKIDQQNPRRLIRALEVFEATGAPLSSFQQRQPKKRDFTPIKIGLQMPRDLLYERIDKRVDLMMKKGLLSEAKSVFKYRNHNALQTVGYKELFDFFDGTIKLTTAIELIKRNSRRYAKRQLTWFKKDSEIIWFDYKTPLDSILAAIIPHGDVGDAVL